MELFKEFKPIAKFVVPVLGAVAVAAQAALSDNSITTDEWKHIGVAALTALLVYLVPNKPAETNDSSASGQSESA